MEEQRIVVDVSEVEYTDEQLLLFDKQMQQFNCEQVFILVWRHRNQQGLSPHEIEDYKQKRRYYDRCFAVLEFAAFIEKRNTISGREHRYYPSIRGIQYANYLRVKKEKSNHA